MLIFFTKEYFPFNHNPTMKMFFSFLKSIESVEWLIPVVLLRFFEIVGRFYEAFSS